MDGTDYDEVLVELKRIVLKLDLDLVRVMEKLCADRVWREETQPMIERRLGWRGQ